MSDKVETDKTETDSVDEQTNIFEQFKNDQNISNDPSITADNDDLPPDASDDKDDTSEQNDDTSDDKDDTETGEQEQEQEQQNDDNKQLDSSSVTLSNGQKIPVAEFEQLYINTQEKIDKINIVEKRYENIFNKLNSLIPKEPDISLLDNPDTANEYHKQMAIRERAIKSLNDMSSDFNETKTDNDKKSMEQYIATEESKLLSIYPDLRDTAKANAFYKGIGDTGRQLGFTDQELNHTYDARLLNTLNLARIGLQALENQKNIKKGVVEKPKPKVDKATKSIVTPSDVEQKRANAWKKFMNSDMSTESALKYFS